MRPANFDTVTIVGYTMVDVDDIEGAGPGGVVRFVRRPLGG